MPEQVRTPARNDHRLCLRILPFQNQARVSEFQWRLFQDASSRPCQVNLGKGREMSQGDFAGPVLSTGMWPMAVPCPTLAHSQEPPSYQAWACIPRSCRHLQEVRLKTVGRRCDTPPQGPSFLLHLLPPSQGKAWPAWEAALAGCTGQSSAESPAPPRLTPAQGRSWLRYPTLAAEPSGKTSWRRCYLSRALEGVPGQGRATKFQVKAGRQKLGRAGAGESAVGGPHGARRLGNWGQAAGRETCLLASWESAVASQRGPQPWKSGRNLACVLASCSLAS